MRQRCSGAPCRDGLEAVASVLGDLCPKGAELDGGVPFGDDAVVRQALFEPEEELLHREAVCKMGAAHSGDFGAVLHRFPALHRGVDGLEACRAQQRRQVVVQAAGGNGAVQVAEGNLYLFVVAQHHAVVRQRREGLVRLRILHRLLEHEPVGGFAPDQQEGNHQRVEFNIGSADVQRPGNLIQCVQQDVVGAVLFEPFPQPAETVSAAFAGIHLENRRLRNLRAVFPDGVDEVGDTDDVEGRVFTPPRRLYFRCEIAAYAKSVQGDVGFVFLCKMLRQPLRDGHLLRNAHLVELHAGAFQLLHRLNEIAGIGPESGMVEGDHHVARFAGEAGEPLYAFPPFGRILASVRVAAREHHGVPAAAAHHRA